MYTRWLSSAADMLKYMARRYVMRNETGGGQALIEFLFRL